MKEKIGNVILNYQYYNGSDDYTDGKIEDELLSMVEKEKDISKLLEKDNRWAVLYHLSTVRRNILEWYPFNEGGEILEIGSGCGAVTGILSEKGKTVTCIELSKKRSLINANRNYQCGNVEIMVGNFNDIHLNRKFDYITLIGVLEYANFYTAEKDPFKSFLKKIRSYLKKDGKLLIAIENKFGLKYWNGAKEDHTGIMFDGLSGYHISKSPVRTFSKQELRKLLEDSGYHDCDFYYPFPDYKFPTQIFSDHNLPKAEDLIGSTESYDTDRIMLFDETAVYNELLKAGEFPFFANSFFVEASIGEQ